MANAFFTLLDAVTGLNQIVDTLRARLMLAVIANTGTFLPKCLKFGPHNGPEDFAYVVDQVCSPGAEQKRRFCKEWLAYVDDVTIRTGRVVEGQFFTDDEVEERIRLASQNAEVEAQSAQEALSEMGYFGDPAECAKPSGRRAEAASKL